jgi:hypothetical protein
MLKKIDRSQALSRLIQKLSDSIARQRGLPVIIGIALVILSLIVQSLNVWAGNQWLAFIGVILLHGGVLIALIGLTISTPLGK